MHSITFFQNRPQLNTLKLLFIRHFFGKDNHCVQKKYNYRFDPHNDATIDG